MKPRLSYANVMATIAVFAAFGGSAYAAGAFDGGDIQNNSLTGKDIRNNSIKARDVAGLGANVVVRTGTPATGSQLEQSIASCNKGETTLSGGYTLSGNIIPQIIADGPVPTVGTPTGWSVIGFVNTPPIDAKFTVTTYALCAS